MLLQVAAGCYILYVPESMLVRVETSGATYYENPYNLVPQKLQNTALLKSAAVRRSCNLLTQLTLVIFFSQITCQMVICHYPFMSLILS